MAGFGSIAPYYDPATGLPMTQPEEPAAGTPPAEPSQQGGLSRALRRLTGTQFGEPRFQLWPEKVARSALSLPHDVMSGELSSSLLRREDLTDVPYEPKEEDRSWLGRKLGLYPAAPQPSDPYLERVQDLAGVAGGGMMFGSLARPAAETGVRVLGRQVLEDSASHGAPLAALEQGKALAVDRRNKGFATGKSAAGWDFKRPDPEPGSFDALYQQARDAYRIQDQGPASPFLTPEDHSFINSGKFYEDAATPGAPLAALEHSNSPRNVNWGNIEAAERGLSPEASRALDSWVGGTVDTMAQMEKGHHAGWGIFNRNALQKNPAALNEISASFQPLRDQLKAEHGDTVTLHRYRGDIPENAKPHDLLSFTTDKNIAEGLSGARKEVPLVPESEIATREAELDKTGRTQISKNTWLEKKSEKIWNGKEEVPIDYIAIMRPDGMVTDTPSVREYFADENKWRQEGLDARKKALGKVSSYEIPVDDIVGATNRFGQKEFIVRNSKGLFEDAAAPGAPLAALEHPAQPYHGLLDQPAGGAYDAPHATETAAAAREAAPAPAGSAGGDVSGGAGGGTAGLSEAQAAAARRAGAVTPLEGLPTKAMKIGDEHFVPGPIESVHQVASDYMAGRELPSYHKTPTKYHPLNEEHSKAIARAFDEMPHTPNDPATKASYGALIKETADQYQAIKKSGLKIEPIPPDMPDPYAANPRLAAKDVGDNNHLWFFPTEGGFGSSAKTIAENFKPPPGVEMRLSEMAGHKNMLALQHVERSGDAPKGAGAQAIRDLGEQADKAGTVIRLAVEKDNRDLIPYYRQFGFKRVAEREGDYIMQRDPKQQPLSDNPMLRSTGEKIGDHDMLANDMFRVVHDYFGHLKEGHGFRAGGEDNAWRSHAAMYSDLARPAMTTETRGQNSWVNYGPHGEANRKASAADTVYADQKVGLMPEWTMRDRGSPEPTIAYHASPYGFEKFDSSKIGAGEGNQSYGHGLYFAGHEPVSEWYRHQLSARRDPILKNHGLDSEDGANIGIRLAATKGDPAPVIADLEKEISSLRSDGDTSKGTQNMIARRRGMVNYLKDPERNKGHMYQVAIDAPPEKFLDWDKPLNKHPPETQGAIKRAMGIDYYGDLDPAKGERAWDAFSHAKAGDAIRKGFIASDDKLVADRLRSAGIPGIKYLDQGSRGSGKGTSNYVMFDAPRMLKRYAVPGLIGAGGFGALARKDEQ